MDYLIYVFVFLSGIASVFIAHKIHVWRAWRKWEREENRREIERARETNARELFRAGPDPVLLAMIAVSALILLTSKKGK